MDDKFLIKQLKSGDKLVFRQLFKGYYPRLKGYCLKFVFDDELANDIVQECFLKLWEKRKELTGISIRSLLFTMVRNSCLNYLKHKTIEAKYQAAYYDIKQGEERLYSLDFTGSADGLLLYEELQEQINIVLDNLPKRSKEIFCMSRLNGLKNREIAEQLKISSTAVEKHISKALHAFNKYFKETYPLDIHTIILIILALH